jgi:hypothetical protein
LRTRDRPTDVEKIRRSAGFSHWNAALTHLLQLYIDGKIDGQKTSKSWVFSAKPKVSAKKEPDIKSNNRAAGVG